MVSKRKWPCREQSTRYHHDQKQHSDATWDDDGSDHDKLGGDETPQKKGVVLVPSAMASWRDGGVLYWVVGFGPRA